MLLGPLSVQNSRAQTLSSQLHRPPASASVLLWDCLGSVLTFASFLEDSRAGLPCVSNVFLIPACWEQRKVSELLTLISCPHQCIVERWYSLDVFGLLSDTLTLVKIWKHKETET